MLPQAFAVVSTYTCYSFCLMARWTIAERRLLVNDTSLLPTSKPAIGQVPRSALLDTLQQFLPGMRQANAELQARLQARMMP